MEAYLLWLSGATFCLGYAYMLLAWIGCRKRCGYALALSLEERAEYARQVLDALAEERDPRYTFAAFQWTARQDVLRPLRVLRAAGVPLLLIVPQYIGLRTPYWDLTWFGPIGGARLAGRGLLACAGMVAMVELHLHIRAWLRRRLAAFHRLAQGDMREELAANLLSMSVLTWMNAVGLVGAFCGLLLMLEGLAALPASLSRLAGDAGQLFTQILYLHGAVVIGWAVVGGKKIHKIFTTR